MISGNSSGAKRVIQPHGCASTTGQVPSGALLETILAPLLLCSPKLGWLDAKPAQDLGSTLWCCSLNIFYCSYACTI